MIEPKQARDGRDAIAVRKQLPKREVAKDAREDRAFVVALDESAGVFDEFAVFDDRGACGFAGAAVEAFVDVIDEGLGDWGVRVGAVCGRRGDGLCVSGADVGEIGLRDVDHLVDAAARGIGFEIPEAVRGAGVEAEAAVDAPSEIFVDRVLAGDRGGCHFGTVRNGTMGDRGVLRALRFRVCFDTAGNTPVTFVGSLEVADISGVEKSEERDFRAESGRDGAGAVCGGVFGGIADGAWPTRATVT